MPLKIRTLRVSAGALYLKKNCGPVGILTNQNLHLNFKNFDTLYYSTCIGVL